MTFFRFSIAVVCAVAMFVSTSVMAQKAASEASTYLVISLVAADSDYYAAAKLLAERHNCQIVNASKEKVGELLPRLRKDRPDHVAFVVEPKDLEINLAQEILLLSTQVDDDPFVDFAYGFITGRNGKAAEKLVNASAKSDKERKRAITLFGVGSRKSISHQVSWALRNRMIPVTSYHAAGSSDEKRDEEFIKESMPRLDQASILLLASHGYPDGLVGGPKAKDIDNRNFHGTISYNIACYTGVTNSWYEDDWSSMKVKKRQVKPEDSFCLKMIDDGVAGYVAYLCPRPAGPTMMGEAMLVASQGKTLGEIQRESLNGVVLAHLMTGEEQVSVKPYKDGDEIKRGRTPGQIVKRMSTGGVLFGDPAFRPFDELADTNPVTQNIESSDDHMTVTVKVHTPTYHFYAGEQINYWEEKSGAFRLEAVIPLNDRIVSGVRVSKAPAEEYHYVAAVEHDRGDRFLRVKMTFAQPTDFKTRQQWAMNGLSGSFEIETDKPDGDTSTADAKIFRG